LEHEPEKIATAKELAVRMGHMARMLRDVARRIFEDEEKTGPLHVHLAGFRKVLLPGLSEREFADMYAQSIAYGLFAAWCHIEGVTVFGKDRYAAFHGMDLKAEQLTREHAAYLLPKTNPFLRKIFGQIVGPDLDDRLAWIVDDLVELLREAKMGSVLRGFGKKGGRSDPVVHFYETFLKEYDPTLRELRGVYYTPDEVVSYIVRSVEWLLKEKFGLKRGLADDSKVKINGEKVHRLLILDPAVGTGTFLFQVIEQIHSRFKRQKGAWSGYVSDHLLPRLFGFEFMMAAYAIAHTRLGLQLSELEYDFSTDERLGIYLTNTLEQAQKISENVFVQGLSEEAGEANRVKKELPIMVVLGNPPYSGHSANRSWEMEGDKKVPNFIGRLLKDYYEVDGEPLREKNTKWLQDDYVKFIRFGQWRIEETGAGILAFITNHAYLDNPTFRGMRQKLMNVFCEIYILDLHGSLKRKETCPDGSPDKNVFDIRQGVAVGMFVKKDGASGQAKVYHADCWGSRESKYSRLSREDVRVTDWKELAPKAPYYLFVRRDVGLESEWEKLQGVSEIFPEHSLGIITKRDNLVTDIARDGLLAKLNRFLDPQISDEEAVAAFGLKLRDKDKWDAREARLSMERDAAEDFVREELYRPFDKRSVLYNERFVARLNRRIMEHLEATGNVGLVLGRQGQAVGEKAWDVIFCSQDLCDQNMFRRGGGTVFPLYLYHYRDRFKGKHGEFFERLGWDETEAGQIPNLSREFVEHLGARVKLEFLSDRRGDLKSTFGPEDLFDYIYGVFHSPEYRRRYAEFLKIDFPRVPWPKGREVFRAVARLGRELVKLHVMEHETLDEEERWPSFPVSGSGEVEKGYPKYSAHAGAPERGKVYINKEQYFEGVRPEVWEFHIGGYQVCEKWLKDRRGRELSFDDIRHYQKVVVALGETIRLMEEPCLVEMFEGENRRAKK
jgi:predicted helicase